MAKNYRIEKEPHFGLDRGIVGPGVCEVIAPEVVPTVKYLEFLKLLEGAYAAGLSEGELKAPRDEFERHLLNCTREVVASYGDSESAYAHTVRLIGTPTVKMDDGRQAEVVVAVMVVRAGASVWEVLDSATREHALIKDVLAELEAPPMIVNKARFVQLLEQHLPELAAATVAPTVGEGAHGAGPDKSN